MSAEVKLDEGHLVAALNALDPMPKTAAGRTERVARAIAEAEQRGELRGREAERAEVLRLERELTKLLCFAPWCQECGKSCEPQRWAYAVPTCYSCLPPPEPIESGKHLGKAGGK